MSPVRPYTALTSPDSPHSEDTVSVTTASTVSTCSTKNSSCASPEYKPGCMDVCSNSNTPVPTGFFHTQGPMKKP